jgi:cyclic-di-GMP-binding protein
MRRRMSVDNFSEDNMASEFSFDVVSKVDLHAVEDGYNTAVKELGQRYDFRGSAAKIEFDMKEPQFTLTCEDDMKMRALFDMLQTRLAKRGVPLKNLQAQKVEPALGGNLRQVIKIQQGIPSDKAKEMTAEIKKSGLKVQPSIQADQLRVTSRSKDSLQETMTLLKSKDFGVELQFTNYR